MRLIPGHPLAPPSGMVAVARLVLHEKIGPGTHPCHWCGDPVTWMPGKGLAEGALIADHLDWNRHNDAPENLVASCNACNAHRTRAGDRRRIRDDEVSVTRNGEKRRAVERTCEVCGAAFLAGKDAIRRGGGKTCSKACAGKLGAIAKWGKV